MLRIVFKLLKYTLALVALALILAAGWLTALYLSADMKQPEVEVCLEDYPVVAGEGYTECQGSMLRQSESGLWEMYLVGEPLQRGVAHGKLAGELLYYQESVFVEQIRRIVPSDGYLKFLRFFLVAFNRKLGENVPAENREEIYGISLSCTHEYDAIGTPYERQLNYHAAHDIGHTMQDYMLVGCSSFGVWGGASADSSLLLGRNFDFWVGDDFAANKIVSFYAPDDGYRFASVGWAGMTGVLSGMNEAGLTVTLNAAKGPLPTSSATPISILAREILQYAATIDEALAVARERSTFVSESLMIGSARDGEVAIIEKTPDETALYRSEKEYVLCTNHFQSQELADDEYNVENIAGSDSPYRYRRLEQLVDRLTPVDAADAAAILRDRRGLDDRDIGVTNEKSLNQSIAHHAVIFKPTQGLMWVSTDPWQSGRMVCYDLRKIFASPDFSKEIYDTEREIPADIAFLAEDYRRVIIQREYTARIRKATDSGEQLSDAFLDEYVANNPEFYYVYKTLADYYAAAGNKGRAAANLKTALDKEIPRAEQRRQIEKMLIKLER